MVSKLTVNCGGFFRELAEWIGVEWNVCLFGVPRIRIAGENIPLPRTRKSFSLLALLIINAGTAVSRTLLAESLWPDTSADVGATNLRQALAILRRTLEPVAPHIQSPNKTTLRLDPNGLSCDLWAFDDAIARGDWEAAVRTYTGPLLADSAEDWLLLERQKREKACLASLHHLAEEATQPESARSLAEQAVFLAPLDEPTQRLLYTTLARVGNLAAARAAFHRFRTRLWQEQQQAPSPETLAHIARLSAPGTTPLPEGPHFLTSFVGRETCLRELGNTASDPEIRLLTLLGPGGMGKTRLAVKLAQTLVPEGIPFVDLAALPPSAPTETLYNAIANALHLRLAPTLTAREAVRVAAPEWLLLDNAETVLETCATVVTELLTDCPGLHLLVTSRQVLGVPGETRWSVPPLNMEESTTLFRARARNTQPTLILADTVAQAICEKLDGIPLALELAAGRLSILPPVALLTQLETQRLPVLRTSHATVPRHATLQATLEGSWALLSPTQQHDASCLAIFASGWTPDAAHAVLFTTLESWEVLDRIEELVHRSLVSIRVERTFFLDTIREFALAQLSPDERADLQQRHTHYYTQLAERDRELSRLPQERDNLRAALENALPVDALRLYVALGEYFLRLGHFAEGRHYAALLLAKTPADHPARPWACYEAGRQAQAQNDLLEAEKWFREGMNSAGEDLRVRVSLLGNLGLLARSRGDLPGAESLYQEAATLATEHQFTSDLVTLRIRLAILAEDRGEPQTSFQLLRELLDDLTEPHQDGERGIVLGLLGGVARRLGNHAQALEFYRQALPLHERFGYLSEIARVCLGTGLSLVALGEHSAALPFLRRAADTYHTLGDFEGEERAIAAL